MNETADRDLVNSLAKGLNMLMCFAKNRPIWTLSEIAQANEMNLPTARRYLYTLTTLGFLTKDKATKTFQLTPKVLRLGGWVMESMDIKDRLMPFMKSIRDDLNVTTHCAVLEGLEIVAIERIRSSDVVNIDLRAGSRLPIYATSLGKAIVAYLDPEEQERIARSLEFTQLTPHTITDKDSFLAELVNTRERGFALADQELTIGLKTKAIPIFDQYGIVEAAFGVSYPLSRVREQGFEEKVEKAMLDVRNKI